MPSWALAHKPIDPACLSDAPQGPRSYQANLFRTAYLSEGHSSAVRGLRLQS